MSEQIRWFEFREQKRLKFVDGQNKGWHDLKGNPLPKSYSGFTLDEVEIGSGTFREVTKELAEQSK